MDRTAQGSAGSLTVINAPHYYVMLMIRGGSVGKVEKAMAAPSSVPPWRIPGTGEPGGLLSMGSHRVGHD